MMFEQDVHECWRKEKTQSGGNWCWVGAFSIIHQRPFADVSSRSSFLSWLLIFLGLTGARETSVDSSRPCSCGQVQKQVLVECRAIKCDFVHSATEQLGVP